MILRLSSLTAFKPNSGLCYQMSKGYKDKFMKAMKMDPTKLDLSLQSWEKKQLNEILSKNDPTRQTPEEKRAKANEFTEKQVDDIFNTEKGAELYENIIKDDADKESILRTFRKNDYDFTKKKEVEEHDEDKIYKARMDKFEQQNTSYFGETKTDTEIMNKTRHVNTLTSRAMCYTPDEEFNKNYVDYDRYGSYKENYMKLQENVNEEGYVAWRQDEREMYGKSIQQFLKSIDSDIIGHVPQKIYDAYLGNLTNDKTQNGLERWEDQTWNKLHGFQKPESLENKHLEGETEVPDRAEKVDDFDPDTNKNYDFDFDSETYLEENLSRWDGFDMEEKQDSEIPSFKFSIDAKFELYENYLKGETIRNLSLKYGLVPERVYAIIWHMQYFVEHILPKADIESLKSAFFIEREIVEENVPAVSYGIDLQVMRNRQNGVEIKTTRFRETPANPPSDETKQKAFEIFKKAKKIKKDVVPIKYSGNSWNGYYIKDKKIYRGHGSERVTRDFKSILQNSGVHDRGVKRPVELKLRQGASTRYAAKGFGIK